MVTDAPYGLKFMGKKWDYEVPSADFWKEVYRVMKPGAHGLIACGTRTQHRMVTNIEDAGFEIRDVITWHYGSGFPKSRDISKDIDEKEGVERTVIGTKNSGPILTANGQNARPWHEANKNEAGRIEYDITAATSPAAKEWEGWGTALKPATEFFTLVRKPLSEDTIMDNVLLHGTGAINIEASRIDLDGEEPPSGSAQRVYNNNQFNQDTTKHGNNTTTPESGRFPANVIFDPFTASILDDQTGTLKSGAMKKSYEYKNNGFAMGKATGATKQIHDSNEGGASRFFYCAKSSDSERNKGLPDGEVNDHPTVKPIALMRYLVRLITPPPGKVLDCFNGSGTTGIACALEDFNYTGIEMEERNCIISRWRIKYWHREKQLSESQLNLFD